MAKENQEIPPDFVALQETLNQAEATLQGIDRDLQFLVTPEANVEVVRRGDSARGPDRTVVATLAGCDPLLWRAGRPEGAVILGGPYAERPARCAFSGRLLDETCPVELYYQGLSISPERALELAPLLTTLRSLVAVSCAALGELQRLEGTLAGVENRELRALLLDQLVKELAHRLVVQVSPPPETAGDG